MNNLSTTYKKESRLRLWDMVVKVLDGIKKFFQCKKYLELSSFNGTNFPVDRSMKTNQPFLICSMSLYSPLHESTIGLFGTRIWQGRGHEECYK